MEAAKTFGSFNKPVLVVWGKDDPLFLLSHGKRLAASFPNAKFETIDDSYCLVQLDNPTALVDSLHRFLASS